LKHRYGITTTLCNIQEEGGSHLRRGGSLKSGIEKYYFEILTNIYQNTRCQISEHRDMNFLQGENLKCYVSYRIGCFKKVECTARLSAFKGVEIEKDGRIFFNPFQSNYSANRILPSSYLFWAVKRLLDYL
jgi:hypothetical protein